MTNNKDLIAKAKKFYENKNFYEAKSHLIKVLESGKTEKMFELSLYVLISDICYKINDFDNAEKYLLKSIEQGKFNSEIFNLLGNIYLKKRNYKKSEEYYLKSINYDQKSEIGLINLAILYHNLGKQKKAILFYKKILKKNPKNIGALYNLSNLDYTFLNQKKIDDLKKISAEKKGLNNFNLASCYFLLANFEKKNKNFNKEIEFLMKANNYSFETNKQKNSQFNEYWLNIISKRFNKIKYINKNEFLGDTKKIKPIFIIGLPRCGSTLIESIISSGNDKIENLGETNLVNWAFLNVNKKNLESLDLNEALEIDLNKTSKKLLYTFKNLDIQTNKNKSCFSEKSLENFFYIDLILNIYPNAKFIHPYRNLTDNVFAIYKQFLPSISWSHSIENILLYIDNYLSIMNYFKKRYPEKIYSISLENFTNNPKKFSIEIYKFCNLKWNKDCLNFYKRNDLFINTASNNQMRSNVKKYDNSKYEPYKEILNMYFDKYSWLKNED